MFVSRLSLRRATPRILRRLASTEAPQRANRNAYLLPLDPEAPPTPANTSGSLLADALTQWTRSTPAKAKSNTLRTFYDENGDSLTFISLGLEKDRKVPLTEAIRTAVGKGVRAAAAEDQETAAVNVGVHGHPHAASVAAHLARYKYTLKSGERSPEPTLQPFGPASSESVDSLTWETGRVYAEAQNLARTLMEQPGNLMTPTIFCDTVSAEFKNLGLDNLKVNIHDKQWAKQENMNAFLAVAQGSSEPLRFLEIVYNGAEETSSQPMVWVGKGVTFDTGGISIKPSSDMKLMRGDMGGAATVVSAAIAVAKLKLPINLVVLVPLTENMPGSSACKPGDVVTARNGKTIEIDNTDAEGRLILADALHYGSSKYKPHTIVDVATLTGAMMIALGSPYSGVFSSSDCLWTELHAAGEAEFDRLWRMPLDDAFAPQLAGSNADLCNVGGRAGGACTAAWFLRSFVEGIDKPDSGIRWAHLDIAGSMEATSDGAYQRRGMTGRPTRALVEFARRLALANKAS